MVYDCIMIKLG